VSFVQTTLIAVICQCVWEEAMAGNLAEHFASGKGRLIAFTGNGHIVNRFSMAQGGFW
jgi:hypothetical protein